MSSLSRVAAIFILSFVSVSAKADISTGPKPVEDRFAESDLVCRCVLSKLVQTNKVLLQNGKLAPANYRAIVTVIHLYKGAVSGSEVTIRFEGRDPAWGAPLIADYSFLLFLKESAPNLYEPVESDGAIVILPYSGQETQGAGGLQQLESDIRESLRSSKDDTTTRGVLQLLLQFRRLTPATMDILERTSRSSVPDTAVLSLEILCRSGSDLHRYLPQLISALSTYKSAGPPASSEIGTTLATAPTSQEIPALERLSDSPIPFLRRGAMAGIRKIRDPGTVPFLIHKLDATDEDVQYTAVVTLAEVTGKSGEFGPGMGVFENSPTKHIEVWKTWWEREGKAQYATPHL